MARLLSAVIWVYRMLLSPLLGPNCRFEPSCSVYASDALARFGAGRGSVMALRRIMRCHPWGGSGWDPVPELGCARGGTCGMPASQAPAAPAGASES